MKLMLIVVVLNLVCGFIYNSTNQRSGVFTSPNHPGKFILAITSNISILTILASATRVLSKRHGMSLLLLWQGQRARLYQILAFRCRGSYAVSIFVEFIIILFKFNY